MLYASAMTRGGVGFTLSDSILLCCRETHFKRMSSATPFAGVFLFMQRFDLPKDVVLVAVSQTTQATLSEFEVVLN